MNKQFHPSTEQQTPVAAEPAGVKVEAASGEYQYKETRELVSLVKDAVALIRAKGKEVFDEFRTSGSRWRKEDIYIFVLDTEGNMLVHPDPELEGKNQLNLKDVNGKPIIQGLISAATTVPDKPEGWYHYEWPVPGGLLPRWKSSYVQLVKGPSGKNFIVGSGMYNDRMEREFVVDMVRNAVGEIEKRGKEAFPLFHDRTSLFWAKDAYVFVIDMDGFEVVHPAFPNLEGTDQANLKDTQGKMINQEIIRLAKEKGSGWIDYQWPKPGESVSTQKSTYIHTANLEGKRVIVGCGVYLADAPKTAPSAKTMTATELMALVREAAALLEKEGESAFPEFKRKGSKWLHDDIYFWVWTLDGTRILHPEVHTVKPEVEGLDVREAKDLMGKPYGKMFLETAATPEGEGWIHCVWPKPYEIFPSWKSCFVKRVTFPSGKQYLTGSGVYNMKMEKALIEDVVNRAAALITERGKEAFSLLRDKTGPFYFMDTYVFVETPDGVELVNPAQPSLEGKNLLELKDLQGKEMAREEIQSVMKNESAWLKGMWYKPGDNTPALKETYVRKVQHGNETYIVGSGLYTEEDAQKKEQ